MVHRWHEDSKYIYGHKRTSSETSCIANIQNCKASDHYIYVCRRHTYCL